MLQIIETRKEAENELELLDTKYRKSQELEAKIIMLMDLAGLPLKETEQARLESMITFYLDHHPN